MLKHYLGVTARGLLMGAADVVPGVSGGTVAFITGIYEELINSLTGLNLEVFKVLKNDGLKAFWEKINGSFLLSLFLGIFISLMSLAKVITHVLEV
jgi:putative membrane protein